jgi:ATP-dependent protease ClpP protease subunit
MNTTIKIKNEADSTTIDIEGIIGIAEEWQFENPESRVATYERFKESVSRIADIRGSEIRVNIRSTGGDVNDALLIYEALRATGAVVTTCCYGYTASAATIVAQAASPGRRLIAPSALYLIHNSLCSAEGNAEELEAEVAMLRQTDARLAEIYATRSGRSVEEIAALMSESGGRGRWLSPAEAIAEGLVDSLDEQTLVQRAVGGVKALLRTIGLGEGARPEDVNYRMRRAPQPCPTPEASAGSSMIAFEEAQRSVKPTEVKAVEDPAMVEMASNPRQAAYESDARNMRMR